jgi:RNA polymerase sigma factor (sigma-70 family)
MPVCIERASQGDRSALNEVIIRLRPRIERMAVYYGRRCGTDADDLLQEAWLGVLAALPNVDPTIGSPEQHLIKRAKWRLLDTIKRESIRKCEALPEEADAGFACSEEIVASANASQFRMLLKPAQRNVLDCLLAGLTWREAGRVLGCTSANIAYYVRQIRRRYEEWSEG